MSHRDISRKNRDLYFFWVWLEHTREKFWGRHMLCRIFRPIDWYHSLVPKKFFSGVIQDLGPFLESTFCPITQKRLFFSGYFRFWGPIIFQFPIRWPIHFWGGGGVDLFWKLFLLLRFSLPVLLNLTRSEESLFWEKTVANCQFHFSRHVAD